MNIVFFGSGRFGLPSLRSLAAEHQIVGVVSQPDRPAGRARTLTPTPVMEWSRSSLPEAAQFTPEDVNEPSAVTAIRTLPADAFVVIAFGQKLGGEVLRDRFAINLHASLLPRWRGAAPIVHAMLAGDQWTGDSVILVAPKMDAGAILGQSRRRIEPHQTAAELHDQLAEDGPALLLSVLRERAAGRLRLVEQDSAQVTLAPKLSKRDGWVDFEAPAEECRRRIHALNPWPGVEVRFREMPLRLLRAKVDDPPPQSVPGEVRSGAILSASEGLVRCAGGSVLRLLEVRPASGRPMSWAEFARGRRPSSGELLVSANAC